MQYANCFFRFKFHYVRFKFHFNFYASLSTLRFRYECSMQIVFLGLSFITLDLSFILICTLRFLRFAFGMNAVCKLFF